jgi:hypothetical protein
MRLWSNIKEVFTSSCGAVTSHPVSMVAQHFIDAAIKELGDFGVEFYLETYSSATTDK